MRIEPQAIAEFIRKGTVIENPTGVLETQMNGQFDPQERLAPDKNFLIVAFANDESTILVGRGEPSSKRHIITKEGGSNKQLGTSHLRRDTFWSKLRVMGVNNIPSYHTLLILEGDGKLLQNIQENAAKLKPDFLAKLSEGVSSGIPGVPPKKEQIKVDLEFA